MRTQATLYSAQTGSVLKIEVGLSNDKIVLSLPDNSSPSYKVDELQLSNPIGRLPLVIELPNRDRLEIQQSESSKEIITKLLPKRSKVLLVLENNMKLVLTSLVGIILFLILFFKIIVPFTSEVAAKSMPVKYLKTVDEYLLKQILKEAGESELTEVEQNELQAFFKQNTETDYDLVFIKGRGLRANAFALSGSTIIFTDEIVKLLKDEKKLLAILFHEIGHLKERHVARNLVSSAAFSIFAFFAFGDVEGIAVNIGAIGYHLLTLKHSQGYEVEADEFAVAMLERQKFTRSCFIEALQQLSEYYEDVNSIPYLHYFSSHPETQERIQLIEGRYGRQNRMPCDF